MNSAIPWIAAAAAGISATLFAYLVLKQLSDAGDLETINVGREERRRIPLLFRLLLPLTVLTRGVARRDISKTMCETEEARLRMAGYSEVFSGADFVALRYAAIVAGMLVLLLSVLAGRGLYGTVLALLLVVYPKAWLTTRINQRHLAILKALPNMLDLLTLSVEAGKDFVSSLRDILLRRKLDALGEEFMRTFQEIQLGKKRTDALRDMGARVRQPDLVSTLNAVIQAEEMGVSIAHLLRIQGDTLRNKRFNRAEKLANEAPVKIIAPIVIFIFPAVFIILGVPIFVQAARFFQ